MLVVPEDLEGVAPHQFGAVGLERVHTEHRKRAGRRRFRSLRACAGCARALVAQVAVGVRAHVPIGPVDGQRVVACREFDLLWRDLHGQLSAISYQRSARLNSFFHRRKPCGQQVSIPGKIAIDVLGYGLVIGVNSEIAIVNHF